MRHYWSAYAAVADVTDRWYLTGVESADVWAATGNLTARLRDADTQHARNVTRLPAGAVVTLWIDDDNWADYLCPSRWRYPGSNQTLRNLEPLRLLRGVGQPGLAAGDSAELRYNRVAIDGRDGTDGTAGPPASRGSVFIALGPTGSAAWVTEWDDPDDSPDRGALPIEDYLPESPDGLKRVIGDQIMQFQSGTRAAPSGYAEVRTYTGSTWDEAKTVPTSLIIEGDLGVVFDITAGGAIKSQGATKNSLHNGRGFYLGYDGVRLPAAAIEGKLTAKQIETDDIAANVRNVVVLWAGGEEIRGGREVPLPLRKTVTPESHSGFEILVWERRGFTTLSCPHPGPTPGKKQMMMAPYSGRAYLSFPSTTTAIVHNHNLKDMAVRRVFGIRDPGHSTTTTDPPPTTDPPDRITFYGPWSAWADTSPLEYRGSGASREKKQERTRTRIYTDGATDRETGERWVAAPETRTPTRTTAWGAWRDISPVQYRGSGASREKKQQRTRRVTYSGIRGVETETETETRWVAAPEARTVTRRGPWSAWADTSPLEYQGSGASREKKQQRTRRVTYSDGSTEAETGTRWTAAPETPPGTDTPGSVRLSVSYNATTMRYTSTATLTDPDTPRSITYAWSIKVIGPHTGWTPWRSGTRTHTYEKTKYNLHSVRVRVSYTDAFGAKTVIKEAAA